MPGMGRRTVGKETRRVGDDHPPTPWQTEEGGPLHPLMQGKSGCVRMNAFFFLAVCVTGFGSHWLHGAPAAPHPAAPLFPFPGQEGSSFFSVYALQAAISMWLKPASNLCYCAPALSPLRASELNFRDLPSKILVLKTRICRKLGFRGHLLYYWQKISAASILKKNNKNVKGCCGGVSKSSRFWSLRQGQTETPFKHVKGWIPPCCTRCQPERGGILSATGYQPHQLSLLLRRG